MLDQPGLEFQYPRADRLIVGGLSDQQIVDLRGCFSILVRIDLLLGPGRSGAGEKCSRLFQYPRADRLIVGGRQPTNAG